MMSDELASDALRQSALNEVDNAIDQLNWTDLEKWPAYTRRDVWRVRRSTCRKTLMALRDAVGTGRGTLTTNECNWIIFFVQDWTERLQTARSILKRDDVTSIAI